MSRWNSGIRRHTGAYSLLCEQQFGEGAEFDGEMCACRKGYVRNLVHSWLLAQARDVLAEICVLQVVRGGMCRKVARGKGGGRC